MSQVVTLEGFRPSPRYDSLPWTQARIEEGTISTGPWSTLETQALSPVDVDPEHPQLRNFTTELASDTVGLWYRVVFLDATGDTLQPTFAVQNVQSSPSYATPDELARILKVRNPSDEQLVAMKRVLAAAAGEIDSEIDLDDDTDLEGWQLALATEVNLERAVEHWRQQEAPFGLISLEGFGGAERTARDTWERHANKLAPLKDQWGFA